MTKLFIKDNRQSSRELYKKKKGLYNRKDSIKREYISSRLGLNAKLKKNGLDSTILSYDEFETIPGLDEE